MEAGQAIGPIGLETLDPNFLFLQFSNPQSCDSIQPAEWERRRCLWSVELVVGLATFRAVREEGRGRAESLASEANYVICGDNMLSI
uniref:Uncharacterized protein n=1 Tax=Oryza nivara TaxID=4536 RepID=A0A0E0HBV2_ORYNI